MSSDISSPHPRLRPVEVFPIEHEGESMVLVQDPSGLAEGPIVVSPPGFFLMAMMDGRHAVAEIEQAFRNQFGQALPPGQVAQMVQQLDAAAYLESPRFTAYYDGLVAAYRNGSARISKEAESFGADGVGLGPMIDRMLGSSPPSALPAGGRRLAGMIAPHLDYARGGPCYAKAYGALAAGRPARRFVILGTNHFGRATSATATSKDFQTPLGMTRTDRAFLARLQDRCGVDLCEHEFDHQGEHSIELQVLVLQHLFGADGFEIVPVLCHDPCGPTGTAPCDGDGVDLRVFAESLGQLLRTDDTPTVVIAGADLSHIGQRFGDERDLDAPFLAEVERKDREALGQVVTGRPMEFVETLAARGNDTRVCSAGCIYALMTALPGTKGELLGYHQTADAESGTAVTCSAVAFWEA